MTDERTGYKVCRNLVGPGYNFFAPVSTHGLLSGFAYRVGHTTETDGVLYGPISLFARLDHARRFAKTLACSAVILRVTYRPWTRGAGPGNALMWRTDDSGIVWPFTDLYLPVGTVFAEAVTVEAVVENLPGAAS